MYGQKEVLRWSEEGLESSALPAYAPVCKCMYVCWTCLCWCQSQVVRLMKSRVYVRCSMFIACVNLINIVKLMYSIQCRNMDRCPFHIHFASPYSPLIYKAVKNIAYPVNERSPCNLLVGLFLEAPHPLCALLRVQVPHCMFHRSTKAVCWQT